jgi:hypothetical protein
MRTLLVGLDNPNSDAVHDALLPGDEKSIGARLVELIAGVVPGYGTGAYMLDFARTNLYPNSRRASGIGARQHDRNAAAHVLTFAEIAGVDDIVLIGARTTNSFDAAIGVRLHPLQSHVHDSHGTPIRFWSLPMPTDNHDWYNDPLNTARAGKLLAALRARQYIPHQEVSP